MSFKSHRSPKFQTHNIVDMPQKDEELFGVTEIYLDGEKITESNPFGFSVEKPSELNNGYVLEIDKDTFEAQFEIAQGSLKELLTPKYQYDLACIEIDGLKYTFTDGRDTIKIEFREIDDEIAKIKLGTTYSFRENGRES